MSDPDRLQEALALARKAADEDEVPVGAVVVHEGKVIARAHNRREQDGNPVAHAEILAIQEAARTLGSWRLVGCTLYVTLEPCPMCLAACMLSRIDRVVYGARDPKGGAQSLGYALHEDKRLNHRFPSECLEQPECGEILSAFFRKKRS
ncbi:MAG: nucleoside deaminase [Oligoflexia bacterium]|nr:nucleoside deaminase [Oligoflexia bacterium]